MKPSGRIEGSICGAILSYPASRSRQALAAVVSVRSNERHGQRRQHTALHKQGHCHRTHQTDPRICQSGSNKEVPSVYSLARSLYAAAFPQHSHPTTKTTRRINYSTASPAASQPPPIFDRSFPVESHDRQSQHAQPSKEALMAIVDEPDDDLSLDEQFNFFRDTYRSGYAQPDSEGVIISDRRHDTEYPSPFEAHQGDDAVRGLLYQLRKAVLLRLRDPSRYSAEDIYDLYRRLPPDPISYLPARLRHQFLLSLATVDKKDLTCMMRYFAVIADVKASGLTLNRAEWNSAMSFASRYVGTVTETELEAALNLWREMEQDANIKGSAVTFNILFDVASKAGNFTLAEMIYKEMEKRGMPPNRYHHVSLIHFFGLKQDSNGVRAAYRAMVEAGELIDAVVLNCVIAGFLRSGEERAAHAVYGHMRSQHSKAPRLPKHTYNSQKMITKVMIMFAKLVRQHPEMRPALQASSPITPNLGTYRMLITHHAVQLGDMAMVAQYLDEMKFFEVPLHGAIFLALFKGFATHGGGLISAWSEKRLQSIFESLLKAIDDDAAGLYLDTWLAISILRAFDRCSDAETVFKVYNLMSLRWELNEQETDHMIKILHSLIRHKTHQVERLKGLSMGTFG